MHNKIIELSEAARLLYVDYSSRQDHWHSILHSHPFTEFFYVINGKGKFQFSNNEVYNVQEDDLIIVNPNVMHTEIADNKEHLEYIVLGVDGVVFEDENQNEGYSFHNFKDYKHEVLLYLRAMHNETIEKEPFHIEITNKLFQVLLMNILRRNTSKLEVASVSKDENNDCLFIERYIYENSDKDITLDHLSEITFLDKYYLSHLFKKHYGMAPIEYLLSVRLEKAKKLLTTTDFSISHVSSMLGFSNPAYFSQFFKKKTKLSPSMYREQYSVTTSDKTFI